VPVGPAPGHSPSIDSFPGRAGGRSDKEIFMTIKTSKAARVGALAALSMAMTGAVIGAVPSAASAACGGNVGGGRVDSSPYSVQLRSTSSCTMYARFTSDDQQYGAGQTFHWKVERQVNGTYGWLTTHTKTSSTYSFEGHKDTATVPNSTSVDDRFRACADFGGSTYRCSGWIVA
jgi:hypothetical protein